MAYVSIPNDLSKIKTKLAFNLTSRQLVCFGCGAAVGIPAFLLTRSAMFLMLAVMLPAFFMAMYEKDGQPFEKVVRNIVRAKLLRPGVRPYQTENLYAPFAGQVEKEEPIAEKSATQTRPRHG